MAARPVKKSRFSLPGKGRRVRWGRLYACAQAEAVVRLVAEHDVPALLVASDMTAARRFHDELRFFAPWPIKAPTKEPAEGATKNRTEIFLLPDWETLPYDPFSPREEITAQRINALYRLPNLSNGVCIVAADTLLQRVIPPDFLRDATFSLKVGDALNSDDFRRKLSGNGYVSVPQVTTPGEYAVRGSVIDFHPPAADLPVRVDLFGDTIESLRLFTPDGQTSVKKVDSVLIHPAREFALDEDSVRDFQRRFRAAVEDLDTPLYRDVGEGAVPGGIEYYLPLFFDEMATLFDYLPENTVIFPSEDLSERVERHWDLIARRYQQAQLDHDRPLLPPERLFLDERALNAKMKHFRGVEMQSFEIVSGKSVDGGTRLLPTLFADRRFKDPLVNFRRFLDGFDGRVLIAADSPGRRERIEDTLRKAGVRARVVEGWSEFRKASARVCLCLGTIHAGVEFERGAVALVCDAQILGTGGGRAGERGARRGARREPDAAVVIRNLDELTDGCPVVHEEHGVGRYRGLQHLDVGEHPFEFVVIEYAGGDKLYVPVSSLHLVTRYTGGDLENVPLHALGDGRWKKAKRKAARKAFDVAAELLDTQARRKASRGVACRISDEDHARFAASFPYEETPDQLTAMEEIRADMAKPRPMDRIVCGDVGFGKTEIAMRAALIALLNGRQAVVLAPTTLLANQHYDNFGSRFADWPVRVEVLSRFVGRDRQRRVVEGLADGTVDVVIGTHKLLTRDLPCKRLGLIVIDEEQRFGVRQKERLKALAADGNVLTLTATPIPRTLSMSLSGLRDLSLITTPPPDRRAIKTFVNEWSNALIVEVCQRELHRGGQIYFIHNRIESIGEITDHLRTLLPGVSIRYAHGQMRKNELESVMLDFYRRRFDVLVCTTIIESGIDIPSVNSIVINEAERFGLAQLHQLRGRVGRSHYQAYAYLALGGPRARLPNDARKRLEAIESAEQLGTGFTLAMHDLEIRGAGELLGREQSGHIQEVGFSMYNELLKRAVKTLRSGRSSDRAAALNEPLNVVTEVDLGEPALIPEDYVPDVSLRLVLYRRIAAAGTAAELKRLKEEMADRFGPLPDYALNLFDNAAIRLKCFALGVRKLEISASGGSLHFDERPRIDVDRLLDLLRKEPETYRFNGSDRLAFSTSADEPDDRRRVARALLARLGRQKKAA